MNLEFRGLLRRRVFLFFELITWSFSVFLVILFCLFCGTLKYNLSETEDVFGHLSTYKYLAAGSLGNSTKIGFFRSSQFYENNHISEKEGVKTIVSLLGDQEYFCTGSCYCENDVESLRRYSRSQTNIFRRLLFIISASSSIFAFRAAVKYLDIECSEIMSESCSSDSIRSEVDDCQDNLEEESESSIKPPKSTEFECMGKCTNVDFVSREEYIKVENDDSLWNEAGMDKTNEIDQLLIDFDINKALVNVDQLSGSICQNLEMRGKVTVDREGSFEIQEEKAINKFTSVNLFKFCKSRSLFTIEELSRVGFGSYGQRKLSKFDTLVLRNFARNKESGASSFSICRARKYNIIGYQNGLNVVCFRQFTPEEWEAGTPYENNNLRHWKETHKRYPDKMERKKEMYILGK